MDPATPAARRGPGNGPHAVRRAGALVAVLALAAGCTRASAVGTWRPLDVSGAAPSASVLVGGASDGARAFLWGGSGGCTATAACADGAVWEASSTPGQAIPSDGAPSPRYGHVQVWASDRLIVWGGTGCGTQLGQPCGDGASWDGTRARWLPVAAKDAPSPRGGAGAAWTGSALLVWGGEDTAGRRVLGDGARYFPTEDRWEPLPAAGAPSPRRYHAVVWTGDRLLVWGGSGGVIPDRALGDGAAFDPSTGTWTPLPSEGAPSPRWAAHVAWTGRWMLVWGGVGCGADRAGGPGFCGDGARYDAAAGVWSSMASSGAPSARSGAAAAWNGSGFVVWGGAATRCADGSSGACADGAVYDPTVDRWRPITTASAPSARSGATAVPLGTAVLLWGGTGAAEVPLRDGALLE